MLFFRKKKELFEAVQAHPLWNVRFRFRGNVLRDGQGRVPVRYTVPFGGVLCDNRESVVQGMNAGGRTGDIDSFPKTFQRFPGTIIT